MNKSGKDKRLGKKKGVLINSPLESFGIISAFGNTQKVQKTS